MTRYLHAVSEMVLNIWAEPMAYLFKEAMHQSCFPTAQKAAVVSP